MDNLSREQRIIENYRNDEKMMILIYVQWCINHDLDSIRLYKEAYPNQMKNDALQEALALSVPKDVADDIDDQTILDVLQWFGNDDLAFIVQEKIEKRKKT